MKRDNALKFPSRLTRYSGAAEPEVASDSRTITFVISDSSVGRDGLTLATKGWEFDNYRSNPVVLFGHHSRDVGSVIGRTTQIRTVGDKVLADVDFMSGDINPLAETVFQMVRGKYLNAVSVGFRAIEGSPTKDRTRPGGYDITRQELEEISVVPVPALPTALAAARDAGIDVSTMIGWANRLLASTNAAASGERSADVESANASAPNPLKKSGKRGLYAVSLLAGVLSDLGYIEDMTEYEAAMEEDGSAVPQMLVDCMKQLGQALIAMTIEEVSELVADDEDGEADDAVDIIGASVEMMTNPVTRGALVSFARAAADGREIEISIKDGINHKIRAGRVLSKANEKQLREAHDHLTRATEMISGVVEKADGDGGEDTQSGGDDDSSARAAARAFVVGLKKTPAKA